MIYSVQSMKNKTPSFTMLDVETFFYLIFRIVLKNLIKFFNLNFYAFKKIFFLSKSDSILENLKIKINFLGQITIKKNSIS